MGLGRESARSVFASVSRYLAVPADVRLRVESFGGIAFDKLTGTLVELDRDVMTMLQHVRNAGIVAENAIVSRYADQDRVADVIRHLIDLGILRFTFPTPLAASQGRTSFAQSIHWPPGPQLTAPETVHWAITYRCDQDCPDCYARRHSLSFTSELDTADSLRLMDILAEWGVFQLAIGGGEPLLRPDLAEICGHAYQNGLVVHVTTGYHNVNCELLRSLRGSISVLQIGVKHDRLLEDPRAECDKLSDTIRSARDSGVHVGANLMLSNTVLAYFDELIDLLAQASVNTIILLRYKHPADQSQWVLETPSPDAWHGFERQFRNTINRHSQIAFRVDCALSFLQRNTSPDAAAALGIRGCVAGDRILALTPDGSAYPCSQSIRPDLRAGSVLTDDLDDLWARSSAMSNCRAFRNSEEYNRSRCGTCNARDHCGGCRVFAGDRLGGDSGCPESVSTRGVS